MNSNESPYGSTSGGEAGRITLPLPSAIDLSNFEFGNNCQSVSDTRPDDSGIQDRTHLFWACPTPNPFWFKTHDVRQFEAIKSSSIDETNITTLDAVSVSSKQTRQFVSALQSEGSELKDFIVSQLAPVFLCAKDAVWKAQEELRILTCDPELDLSDMEPNYAGFLRTAMRIKLAQFLSKQLDLPEGSWASLLTKDVKKPEQLPIKDLIQTCLAEMERVNGNKNQSRSKT